MECNGFYSGLLLTHTVFLFPRYNQELSEVLGEASSPAAETHTGILHKWTSVYYTVWWLFLQESYFKCSPQLFCIFLYFLYFIQPPVFPIYIFSILYTPAFFLKDLLEYVKSNELQLSERQINSTLVSSNCFRYVKLVRWTIWQMNTVGYWWLYCDILPPD